MAQQTAKEIAEELIYKMEKAALRHDCFGAEYLVAKDCALIAVDEIIANIEPSDSIDVISARIKYWEQVKQEIEKL
jgi:hypothetical protein